MSTNHAKGVQGTLRIPLEQRFWAKVQIGAPDDCWLWTGARDQAGRGQIWADGRKHRAPRIAWSLHNHQPFPDDMLACHTCDNPACVNPAHIWPGTMSENIFDAVAKKRHPIARKTKCRNGHEFTAENTYIRKNGRHRSCKTCSQIYRDKWLKRNTTLARIDALIGDRT